MFVGAPLALASEPLGQSAFFYVGLALLVVALALPVSPGQTLGARARDIVRHLPGARWLGRRG
jgi:hypothetical protein